MKFYCIVDDLEHIHNPEAYEFLRKACEARDITFVPIEVESFDFSIATNDFLEQDAMLYRLSISRRAKLLEGLLARADTATLYRDRTRYAHVADWGNVIALERDGLPIIPTIFGVSMTQEKYLKDYVQKLGGFPVVLKSSGGSHGNSVMRVDSIESLRSVLGFVSTPDSAEFVLRKFIKNAEHIRLVVVGDHVVDAVRYFPQTDDFRTNTGNKPHVEPYARTADVENIFVMAEKAITSRGYALGGVDVLIDEDGEAFIAEVNAPCNFGRNQMNTGVDIAGMIVDYLLDRRKQLIV